MSKELFKLIKMATESGAIILTTHAAFLGFDDLMEFLKEASDKGVIVTFAPMDGIEDVKE